MSTTPPSSEWLRVQQTADLLAVSATTVRRWADSGRLAGRRTPSGQRRFRSDDLEAFAAGAARRRSQPPLNDAEQRYQLLLETSLELASSLELTGVLQSAARRLSAALRIRDCDIYRLESVKHLVCIASTLDGVCDAGWVGQEIRKQQWPCKWLAIETRQAVVVSSLDDPRLSTTERENMRHY